MGKKSGPKAPPPPDPYKVAAAQTGQNRDTAITEANLNRIDQIGPGGSVVYNNKGYWGDGTPRYEQVTSLAPEQQALYDQENRIAQSLGRTAESGLGRVQDTMGRDFNFNNARPLQGPNTQGQQQFDTQVRDAGGIQSTFGTGGPLTGNVEGQALQNQIAGAGDLTRQAGGDFNETSKRAADAVYNQFQSRLDPQFQQFESDMRSRLINSGISENSDAFRREMDNFNRSRTDAYGSANRESVLTGLSAQNQGFNQSLNNARLNNDAQGQQFGQNAAQLDAFNTASNTQFSRGMSNADLNNRAQGQQFQQNAGAAAFGNSAQEQQFGQNMIGSQFRNNAIDMQDNRQFRNADLNNSVRQREIEESTYLRNLPLNDIAALLGTGGGVQSPQFGSPVPQVGVANTDLQGAVYNSFNAQQQQWQQQQQARSAGLGSIFGLAGSLATKIPFSDRRIKHNIVRIGELANGIGTYAFSYIGQTARNFGVMAQEVMSVIPDAVSTNDDGIMYVDYRKLSL